jgi:choline-sulfatase
MAKPDILIFFSDQHSAALAGFAGDRVVRTPNMDKLAADGTVIKSAYTPCPLCVPARAAFLSGLLPEKTMCYTNGNVLPGDHATFIHSIAAEGYDTVLCGRMHFMGEDQRHGFTKRLVGDMTPLI